MAANIQPIYSKIADIQWSTDIVQSANTTTNLTSGTIYPIFTADTTNGGYVQRVRFRPLGSNAATVARVWINNGSDTTVSANNTLWDEIAIALTTVSQTAAQATYELPLNFPLPPSYRLYVTLGTVVSAGFDVTVIGGKY
jgi:hypothetical protein